MASASFNFSVWVGFAVAEVFFGLRSSAGCESQLGNCRFNAESSARHETSKFLLSITDEACITRFLSASQRLHHQRPCMLSNNSRGGGTLGGWNKVVGTSVVHLMSVVLSGFVQRNDSREQSTEIGSWVCPRDREIMDSKQPLARNLAEYLRSRGR